MTKPGDPTFAFHAIQINPMTMRPKSRGGLRLASSKPDDQLGVETRMNDHQSDMDTLRQGIRLARKICASNPLSNLVHNEVWPGEDVSSAVGSNELDFAISRRARTIYHSAGTCSMGAKETAVVGTRLRVNGVKGTRVADCTIMPALVSGNPNAPTMIIAVRAADTMLEDA